MATELACALGERSDAGDWADIRLDGAIPSEMTDRRQWVTRDSEAVWDASFSSSCILCASMCDMYMSWGGFRLSAHKSTTSSRRSACGGCRRSRRFRSGRRECGRSLVYDCI